MAQSWIGLPPGDTYRLANARVATDLVEGVTSKGHRDRLADADIVIAGGRIAAITPRGAPADPAHAALPAIDLRDGLALPRFVDVHTHLDKGHIWPRSPNPDGSFMGALTTVMADRAARWSADDVRRRFEFALKCAYAHGTGAIRTHLDSIAPQADISWPLFEEIRAAWKGRITLQAAAIFGLDMATDDPGQFDRLVAHIARAGGAIGGVTFQGRPPDAKLAAGLDRVFAAAAAHGLDLDFHVDESDSPDATTLETIADAALRYRFRGRIVAGHCCALSLATEDDRARTLAKVRDAGIAIVSLPMCNMYLQDRGASRTPRWRGVAPLHEADSLGIPVMIASDNTRDPFYAYGDLDMLEVFREATRILHLDHSTRPWLRLLGPAPADVMGLSDAGRLRVGGPADMVLTGARTLNELLARPQADRVVIVAGAAIDTTLPDYRELDDLYPAGATGA